MIADRVDHVITKNLKPAVIRLLLLLFSISCFQCGSPDVLWKFKTGEPINGGPAVTENSVIVGSNDRNLYALDLQSGKLQWKSNLGERVLACPLIDGNVIYVGAANGYFFAIEPKDGRILWKWKTDGLIAYRACSDSEGIFFGSDDGTFVKLDRSGKPIWKFQAPHRFWGHCNIYKDVVITSSWDSNFYGFDRKTGNIVWKVSSGLFNYGGGELYKDTVYFGTHDKVYRIQAETGKVLSIIKVGYVDQPTVFKDQLWTLDDGLVKRELNGKELGKVQFRSVSNVEPVVVNDTLIAATTDHKLIAVSPELKIVWKVQGGDEFTTGVYHNGVYYTGNRDSYVYALRLPE